MTAEHRSQEQQGQYHRLFLNLCIPLIVLLGASILWLLHLVDIEFVRHRLVEEWIQVTQYVVNALIGWNIINSLDKRAFQRALHGPLTYFVSINILGLIFLLAEIYDVKQFVNSFVILVPLSFSSILISILFSFAYCSIALAIKRIDVSLLCGYQRPLVIGLYGCALFSMMVVFDVAFSLFLIFTASICLVILAASTKRFSVLDIAGKKVFSIGLVVVGLFLPVFAYGKAPLQLVGVVALAIGTTVGSIFTVFTVNNQYTSTSPQSGAEILDSRILKTTKIFNDQWLLNNGGRLSIDNDTLFRSSDGGRTWEKEKSLVFHGEAIHFDKTGQRGWVGNRYYGMEVTEDGGKSWRQLTPELAYRQATGRRYKEDSLKEILNPISELHLDPETGFGSFTARCSYYFTVDFAATWQSRRFATEGEKKACLLDTPFSVNEDLKLALVKEFLRETLYRYNESKDAWESVCNLSGSELGINLCEDNTTLSEAEQLFASQDWNTKNYYFGGTRPLGRTQELIDLYGEHRIEDMLKPPHKSDDSYWLADEGYMAISNNRGQSWTVEQDTRRFENVLPVSLDVGFAWNLDETLWVTRNSGNTWQPYLDDEQSPPLDIQPTNNGEQLWLLYPYKLVRVNTQTEQVIVAQSWIQPIYTQLRSTDKGRVLWAYRTGSEFVTVSFDSGKTWHSFRDGRVQHTNKTNWTISAITAVWCSSESPTCFILKDDNTLSEMTLNEGALTLTGSEKIALPSIGDEVDEFGFVDIATSLNGQHIVVIPGYGRHVYVSEDRGLNWTKTTVGSGSDYWNPILVSDNGKKLALKRDRGFSISDDFGKSWRLIKVDIDEYNESRFCWSQDAQTMVIYNDDYLTISIDGGQAWAKYDDDQFFEPWCGIGNNILWMKKLDIDISAVELTHD